MVVEALDLKLLARRSIAGGLEVARLLNRLRVGRVRLRNGMDFRNRTRSAYVQGVTASKVRLSHENISVERQPLLFFTFDLDGISYSMAGAPIHGDFGSSEIEMILPTAIHEVERRGRLRAPPKRPQDTVSIRSVSGRELDFPAEILDRSKHGLGLRLRKEDSLKAGTAVSIRFVVDDRETSTANGVVKNRKSDASEKWMRIGLALDPVLAGTEVPIESRTQILPRSAIAKGWSRVALAGSSIKHASEKFARKLRTQELGDIDINVVEYRNQLGQPIRAIIDRVFEEPGGPAVVIPPAWGRTKETLLPLARTLIETFRQASRQLTVLRFDGTQRRGESYIDPECRADGDEHLHFTYSQAAQDLNAAAIFLRSSSDFAVEQLGLITFSLAAIEGRVALASKGLELFDAWIPVVGMTDVQSALKSVSGGIDYIVGKEAGVDFGVHELGGVRIDIDHAASDVLHSEIATLEEAKRDIAKIVCPITWIHGRDDGWTDINKVQELLSVDGGGSKKLIEVPTGHQLRNSREALDTFQLIALEISESLVGMPVRPALPDLSDLERRNTAERRRVHGIRPDFRGFWHDYLLGRDSSVGMQLLGATEFYRDFMTGQIASLQLVDGMTVLDLGAGTGEFTANIAEGDDAPSNLHVVSADLVFGALQRARTRSSGIEKISLSFCAADFECALPFRDHSFDRVLASLLVAYVGNAKELLNEVRRVLRPGGILVLSSPRRDADLSSLYRETISTLSPATIANMVGVPDEQNFDDLQRNYLNEAAKLVDLEELGHFKFRDASELCDLLSAAGFVGLESVLALGNPPQTAVVTGIRGE